MSFMKKMFRQNWAFSFPLLALVISSPISSLKEAQSSADLQVKFLGGDNQALFFDVKYDNRAGSTFKLLALDETGAACFQNKYSTRDFDKKIKVPRLTDTDYVIFLIRSANENIQLSYKVTVTTKVVDETVFMKNRELVSYK
jgi:hypothetical protein